MKFRLAPTLELVSSITQIASYLGLPIAVLGGAVAGLFAILKNLGGLESTLIVIFVVTAILQAVMASVFLVDRILEGTRSRA